MGLPTCFLLFIIKGNQLCFLSWNGSFGCRTSRPFLTHFSLQQVYSYRAHLSANQNNAVENYQPSQEQLLPLRRNFHLHHRYHCLLPQPFPGTIKAKYSLNMISHNKKKKLTYAAVFIEYAQGHVFYQCTNLIIIIFGFIIVRIIFFGVIILSLRFIIFFRFLYFDICLTNRSFCLFSIWFCCFIICLWLRFAF